MLVAIARNILIKTLVDVVPPLLIQGAGHALISGGQGMILTGRLLKSAGYASLDYARAQRERNLNPYGPAESQASIPNQQRQFTKIPRSATRHREPRETKWDSPMAQSRYEPVSKKYPSLNPLPEFKP